MYEAGIGENRAILVEDGRIVEAAIEWSTDLRAGSVVEGNLDRIVIPGRRAQVRLPEHHPALLEPVPSGLTEGQAIRVEVLREMIFEPGLVGVPKQAKVRVTDAALREGPTLLERIKQTGSPVEAASPIGDDALETFGWSEVIEQAERGVIEFEGGTLRMSVTPAMTLFDVDGYLPLDTLAVCGARAAGKAIRLLGITGSIGIDLPTLPTRSKRQAAALALDEVLPQPFERTAVNGFGFLQIVRRRERPSVPERLQGDPVGAALRALLRRAERAGGAGERIITAPTLVIEALRDDWKQKLERRIGAPVALRHDNSLAISAGHVQSAHP